MVYLDYIIQTLGESKYNKYSKMIYFFALL